MGTRQSGITKDVLEFLQKNTGRTITIVELTRRFRLHEGQVQGAISYIKKNKDDQVIVDTLQRGKKWRASAPEGSLGVAAPPEKVTMALRETRVAPQPEVVAVPDSEPLAQFRILGTVKETGELLIQGNSPGVAGVWLAREI